MPDINHHTWHPSSDISDSQTRAATAHRVPILTTEYPQWYYLSGIVVSTGLPEASIEPDEREVLMVGSFVEEYCERFYNAAYRRRMFDFAPYDIDGGANSCYFTKGPDGGWRYRKRTWQHSFIPARGTEPVALESILDRVHTFAGDISPRWIAWKAARPEVFNDLS